MRQRKGKRQAAQATNHQKAKSRLDPSLQYSFKTPKQQQ
jgi:hypothetical protein